MDTIDSAVFVQTNDAASNQVVAFSRGEDGGLAPVGTYATGGRGTGSPHLPSQGSVVVAEGRLFVANAGSDDLSAFVINPAGLELVDRAPAGMSPRSVAVRGDLVYVLGTGGITGLHLGADGAPAPIEGSGRSLSGPEADGAQISFTPNGDGIVVTERVSDAISIHAWGRPDFWTARRWFPPPA
jgi:6-phosphogluconolactonase